jgi:hypothetical protein
MNESVQAPIDVRSNRAGSLFLFFFLSGASGLVYEVFLMRELGVLFGNTAYAVADPVGLVILLLLSALLVL